MGRDFRDLAEQHADAVFTYARYSLRQSEDAEDLTQEVLVRLWMHRDSIAPGRTRAWVMQVARNLVIDRSRRERARSSVFMAAVPGDIRVESVPAPGTPGSETERGELRAVLECAVAELDEPYRSIVIMREIQGMSYDEIAQGLSMPLGTIKVYLHRARRRLRERVREELGPDV
jgi:RNA polymerase sigma-70 factor (ECF subfamily)